MTGFKTFIIGFCVTLLGLLQSAEVTDIVAQHPGSVTTLVGVLIVILRFVTTTSIFKNE